MICWDNPKRLNEIVDIAEKNLTPHKDEFDGIIAAGLSGLIVAANIAVRLDKPLGIVRYAGDKHAGAHVFLNVESIGKRLLFVDDHISSGRTVNECHLALRKQYHAVKNILENWDNALRGYAEQGYSPDQALSYMGPKPELPEVGNIVAIYEYNHTWDDSYRSAYGYHPIREHRYADHTMLRSIIRDAQEALPAANPPMKHIQRDASGRFAPKQPVGRTNRTRPKKSMPVSSTQATLGRLVRTGGRAW